MIDNIDRIKKTFQEKGIVYWCNKPFILREGKVMSSLISTPCSDMYNSLNEEKQCKLKCTPSTETIQINENNLFAIYLHQMIIKTSYDFNNFDIIQELDKELNFVKPNLEKAKTWAIRGRKIIEKLGGKFISLEEIMQDPVKTLDSTGDMEFRERVHIPFLEENGFKYSISNANTATYFQYGITTDEGSNTPYFELDLLNAFTKRK